MNILQIKNEILKREYAFLNDMQKEAVLTVNGPLLVLAGAGSGKTTVLINRISNILNFGNAFYDDNYVFTEDEEHILREYYKERDELLFDDVSRALNKDRVKPWEILAITFTNKAAKEIKERLEKVLGESSAMIWAQTFHSACTKILRREAEAIGYTSDFTIYDETDKKRMLTDIIKSMNLDEKKYDPKMFSSLISRAKDSLLTPRAYAISADGDVFKQKVAEVYSRYQKEMESNNAFDFDDIIVKAVELFEKNPEILSKYQNRFRYVLVDEYQDTNHAQYKLVHMLSSLHQNICVVGDDDQSIYKFRGATIKNILEFERDYEDAKTIRLEQNYRSTSNILNSANGLISRNRKRKGKTLWTNNHSTDPVFIRECQTGQDEAYFISKSILDGIDAGKKFSDFAILYRNHALSNAIEYSLKRMGIPYKMFSGLRFFDRAEVKDMLSYLCVINNANDTLRLKRIINNPPRKIGAKTIEMVEYLTNEYSMSFFEILKNSETITDLKRSASSLTAFSDMILSLKRDLEKLPLDEFYDSVCEKTGYITMLTQKGDPESLGKIENVRELKSSIIEYMERCEEPPSLSGFLEEISLFTDLDKDENQTDCVTMMTIHSSKGLEFENVFITGMENDIFPSSRSLEDPAEVEEERRLCYVAITRAKKNLTLSYSTNRLLYGQTRYYRPSMFLGEIPKEFTKSNTDVSKSSIKSSPSAPFFNKSATTISAFKKPAEPINVDLKTGDRISHKAFGEGLITSTKAMGGDLLLEIAFDKVGTKKLLAKTASSYISKI